MAVLSTILPFISVIGFSVPLNTIILDSDAAFRYTNCFYSVNNHFECDSISYDHEAEYCYISFNYFAFDINIINTDINDMTSSDSFSLVYFDSLSFELPYYTTNIIGYEIEFEVDDWNILNDGILEIFYNIDLFLVHLDGTFEFVDHFKYSDSRVDTSVFPTYFDVDQFLFENNFDFSIIISDIDGVYNSLTGIDGNAWENGYETGTEDGYEAGYNAGYDVGSGENKGILEYIRTIINIFDDIFNIEILPNIKIWYILGIPLILSIVKFALGWFK